MPTSRMLIALTASVGIALAGCAERASSAPPPSSNTRSAAQVSPGDGETPQAGYGPRYDASTVQTIRGQVARVDHTTSARGMSGGVHVLMNTEGGTISVHLGPAWFIESQNYLIQPGDTLEVTGSQVISNGAPALIARTVVKDGDELVLRDEAGFPAWGGAGRGGARLAPTATATPQERNSDRSVLNETEQQALRDALDDEYRAWARYDQIIRDFGPERPFIHIRDAEARHIDALLGLFARYGLEVPENTWPDRVPRYASTREACEASAEAEIANVALFERLEGSTSRQDILTVFGNLKRASQENHLPAFRRCADRGPGRSGRPG